MSPYSTATPTASRRARRRMRVVGRAARLQVLRKESEQRGRIHGKNDRAGGYSRYSHMVYLGVSLAEAYLLLCATVLVEF